MFIYIYIYQRRSLKLNVAKAKANQNSKANCRHHGSSPKDLARLDNGCASKRLRVVAMFTGVRWPFMRCAFELRLTGVEFASETTVDGEMHVHPFRASIVPSPNRLACKGLRESEGGTLLAVASFALSALAAFVLVLF